MTPLDARETRPLLGGPSFAVSHRVVRLAWACTWALLARWSPVPLHGWRRFLLRCFGAQIDRSARIYPSARVWYPPNLTMGAHSCLGPRVDCYCVGRITLGPHALVSQGAVLCSGTHDVDNPEFQLIAKPITVGARAWIAAEAFLGPGVTVGADAVLGARAVSFKDLQPAMIYVGNPAQPTRKRGGS